jgi:Tfp pilus assembly pilus retraction ATPase PilT
MVEAPATKLDPILRLAIELNATDIHVQVGLPPIFRVRGKLVAHQAEPLSAEQCEALVFSIMSEDQKKTFSERLDCDFSHGIAGLARFRINVFLHTKTPAQGIDRIVDVFPPHQQQQARVQLANVLHELIPRRDYEGMALAMEMLLITPAIRNLIREAKTFQIRSLLQTGASSGMLTMEQSLKGLVDKRWICADDALESCFDPKEMARLLGRK